MEESVCIFCDQCDTLGNEAGEEVEVQVQRAIAVEVGSLDPIQWESLGLGSLLGNAIWGAGVQDQSYTRKEAKPVQRGVY